MHEETVNLLALGEYDEELQKKIIADVELIVAGYLHRNMNEVGSLLLSYQQSSIERLALRALKNHLNNASNIY